MANVDNGALSFKSELDNSQLDGAIEETLRRVQGLTDATVSGGQRMDEAFNLTAQTIREKIKEISVACDQHEAAIGELEAKYQELGYQAGQAFMQGRDEEYRKIEEQKNAIHGEIEVRKQLLQELHECSDALEEQAGKIEEHAQKVKENADVAQSMRSRIKELKEEMMNLIDQGIDKQSEAYQRLEDELGRLQDIQSDVAEQGRILAHDQAGFKGVLSGLSGLSGAFSAATGAISLFAGENEDLQKIMTRLQSVMAITIGLQQVSETLNKDSAFSLVTLRGLKEWWAKVVAAATTAETAETAATAANTAAKKIQAGATQAATAAETANAGAIAVEATAAKAGAVANFTLAGAFHAVGVAIKSIPVIGWVLAGVGALIALVSTLTGKTKEQEEAERKAAEAAEEAKRRHEEYQKTIRETGNSVQRNLVSKFLLLREQWSRLKSEAEKADFIKKRAQDFRDFGAAIDSVNKAEQFLNDNTGAIVESIMLRARAAVLMKQIEKSLEDGAFNIDSQGEDEWPSGKYKIGYGVAMNLSKELADVEEQIDKIMSKFKKLGDGDGSSKKDPFVENLKKRKVEYERFKSWVNSGDQVLVEAAQTEFKALLKEGATYIDYLKNQRDKILEIGVDKRTKEQNENLRKLNDALAAETKRTVMDAFNEELSMQLTNARSVLEVLAIIEKRRKE